MIIMDNIASRNSVDAKKVIKEELIKWLESGVMLSFGKRKDNDSAALIGCITVKYGVAFICKFKVNCKNNLHLVVSLAIGFYNHTNDALTSIINNYDVVIIDRVIWDDKDYIIPPYTSREYIIDTKSNDPVQPYKCNTVRSVASYIRRTGDILLYK